MRMLDTLAPERACVYVKPWQHFVNVVTHNNYCALVCTRATTELDMSTAIAISFVLFALATSIIPGSTLICDDPADLTTGVCGQLSKDIERALLKDEGNLFRIRRAFFHSPTASPVLLKMVYNMTYDENFTMAVISEEIPPCFSQHLNPTIDLNQTNITLGWTSSGVYTLFHPAVLYICDAGANYFCSTENYTSDIHSSKEPRSGHFPLGWLL